MRNAHLCPDARRDVVGMLDLPAPDGASDPNRADNSTWRRRD
jgi:hypothetical protein